MTTEYKPAYFLQPLKRSATGYPEETPPKNAGLIILNQPIVSRKLLWLLWDRTSYHLCADGGANRLLEVTDLLNARQPIPDIIHGDLDSLEAETEDFYSEEGVEISLDPDQYSTDFGKAMKKVLSVLSPDASGIRDVLILGSVSGRVDQGLGLLHEMLRETERNQNVRLWLFSETSVSFVVRKGHNMIETSINRDSLAYHCGIIPVYGPATISTKGFKWDVKDWETRMGAQVSTSNHVASETVEIETNANVLFTVELGAEIVEISEKEYRVRSSGQWQGPPVRVKRESANGKDVGSPTFLETDLPIRTKVIE